MSFNISSLVKTLLKIITIIFIVFGFVSAIVFGYIRITGDTPSDVILFYEYCFSFICICLWALSVATGIYIYCLSGRENSGVSQWPGCVFLFLANFGMMFMALVTVFAELEEPYYSTDTGRLIGIAKDDNGAKAIKALGKRRAVTAIPILCDIINNRRKSSDMRVNAAIALGRIGENLKPYDKKFSRPKTELLRAMLSTKNKLLKQEAAKSYIRAGEGALYSDLSAEDHIARGLFNEEKKRYQLALAHYLLAVEAEKLEKNVLAVAYYNCGVAKGKLGYDGAALDDYSEALKLNPEFAKAYNNRGMIYDENKEYAKAIADYTKAIKLNNDKAATQCAYVNRGYSYCCGKEYAKAFADLNKAIALRKDDAMAYNNLGLVYFETGKLSRAVKEFNKAIKFNNNDQASLYAYGNLGKLNFCSGKLDKAIGYYSDALRFDPRDSFSRLYRGIAYFYLDDMRATRTDIYTAYRLDSHDPETTFWFCIIYRNRKSDSWKLSRIIRMDRKNKGYPNSVAFVYLDELTVRECMGKVNKGNTVPDRIERCKTCFYLGMYCLLRRDISTAKNCFAKALECKTPFLVEYAAAGMELKKLAKPKKINLKKKTARKRRAKK